ncbi:MAG: ATP-binding protein [Candidatus Nanopelagicales bacterium]
MIRFGELRAFDLFDGLTDEQVQQLADAGTEIAFDVGGEVFHEGDPAEFWWLLVEGAIDLVRHVGREDSVVGRMSTPGRWAGGFRAWAADGVHLATGRAVAAGRVLRVPAQALRELSTAWFPFGAHLIEGLYSTARSIESTARQRESLVTLGTLAAGLAHELNNPASAAIRAVDGLDAACQTLFDSLSRLVAGELTTELLRELDDLRRQIKPPTQVLDAMTLSDREEELSSWLEAHDVPQGWEIASPLAAAGVDVVWCERVAETLPKPALPSGFQWVASTVSAATLLGEVKESTRRISELVSAARSYSQMDRASLQRIDVTEGLESTLVVLGQKVRDGITIVRDYQPDLPAIEAYAGELNQVWTNLIDNAVDAMGGSGTLRLSTRTDEDGVVVEINDTGAGMPPDVVARAFEAFYTTKEVGKGTGLGLDIARRIICERHGGTVDIQSEPGNTTLSVSLHLRPPEDDN